MFEDQAFFYKLFLHCRTHMASGIFDRYRQHADSCCETAIRNRIYSKNGPSPARGRFLDWFAHYLRLQEHQDPRLRRLVEMRRWVERHPIMVRGATLAVSRTSRVLHRLVKLLAVQACL